jgi:hypothetical protein
VGKTKEINKNQKLDHLTEFYPIPIYEKISYHEFNSMLEQISQLHSWEVDEISTPSMPMG